MYGQFIWGGGDLGVVQVCVCVCGKNVIQIHVINTWRPSDLIFVAFRFTFKKDLKQQIKNGKKKR